MKEAIEPLQKATTLDPKNARPGCFWESLW